MKIAIPPARPQSRRCFLFRLIFVSSSLRYETLGVTTKILPSWRVLGLVACSFGIDIIMRTR